MKNDCAPNPLSLADTLVHDGPGEKELQSPAGSASLARVRRTTYSCASPGFLVRPSTFLGAIFQVPGWPLRMRRLRLVH